MPPVQHTGEIDWSQVELRGFGARTGEVAVPFALPEGELQMIRVSPQGEVTGNPLGNRVRFRVTNP